MDAFDAVCSAGEALQGGAPDDAAEEMARAFERSGREDRVARLGVEILSALRRAAGQAVALGEAAVRAEAAEAPAAPNLAALGEARLLKGDYAGAAEAYGLAVEEMDRESLEPSRGSAWNRFHLGKALCLLGEKDAALAALAKAARLNDNVLDLCGSDPLLAPLREGGRLEEALLPARRSFDD